MVPVCTARPWMSTEDEEEEEEATEIQFQPSARIFKDSIFNLQQQNRWTPHPVTLWQEIKRTALG